MFTSKNITEKDIVFNVAMTQFRTVSDNKKTKKYNKIKNDKYQRSARNGQIAGKR
jgi:hypothetical protein